MATSRATVTINVECPPCVPDWQPTGETRCRNCLVENQEADGCGNTRWTPTAESCACSGPYVPTPPPLPSEQTCFDASAPWRVRLIEPHVLHVRAQGGFSELTPMRMLATPVDGVYRWLD